jgi:hypothetical protein
MFHPKLIAVITAMALLGAAGPGRAEYTLAQLQAIEGLIASRNCEGLWLFVKTNPGLVDGEDPLATELRVFVTATERGQLECFASRSSKSALSTSVPNSETAPSTVPNSGAAVTAPSTVPNSSAAVTAPQISGVAANTTTTAATVEIY